MDRMIALLMTVSLSQAQVFYGYAPGFGYAGAYGYAPAYGYSGYPGAYALAPSAPVATAPVNQGVTPASTTKLAYAGIPYNYAPFYSNVFASPAAVLTKAVDATEEPEAAEVTAEVDSGLPAGLAIRKIFPVFEDSDLKSPFGGPVKFLSPEDVKVEAISTPGVVSVRNLAEATEVKAPSLALNAAPRFVTYPSNVSPLFSAFTQPAVFTI